MKHNKLTSVKTWIVAWALLLITYIVVMEEVQFLQLATLLATIPLAYIPSNVLQKKIELGNEEEYTFLDEIEVVFVGNKTLLNGNDVSVEIRSLEVTRNVSLVSSLKCVRDKMVYFQRLSAQQGLVLMDGRDIGTTVLPDAHVKIFLTASPEERAKRRLKELQQSGINESYEVVLNDIKTRDYKDSNREISPLRKASDAILVDTTTMSIEEVCNTIVSIVCERMKDYGKI